MSSFYYITYALWYFVSKYYLKDVFLLTLLVHKHNNIHQCQYIAKSDNGYFRVGHSLREFCAGTNKTDKYVKVIWRQVESLRQVKSLEEQQSGTNEPYVPVIIEQEQTK